MEPAATLWIHTPPSLSHLINTTIYILIVAYIVHGTAVPPIVAFMSCPTMFGLHTLWSQARKQYETDEVKQIKMDVEQDKEDTRRKEEGMRLLDERVKGAEEIVKEKEVFWKRAEELERMKEDLARREREQMGMNLHLMERLRMRSAEAQVGQAVLDQYRQEIQKAAQTPLPDEDYDSL
jgi:hypothetical protein